MKKYFWSLLVVLFPLFCKAQSWTINQAANGRIYLFNPVTEEYKSVNHHHKGKLVGIDYVNENTCIAVLVKKEDTIRDTLTLPVLVHKKEKALQIIEKDSTSYTYLAIHSGLKINSNFNTGFLKIYRDTNLLLEYKPLRDEKYVHHKLYKQMLPKFISSLLQDIDEQQQTLLLVERHLPNDYGNTSMGLTTTIKEISLKDGSILFKKNNALKPSYSPDKKIILFFKISSDKAFYWDRTNNTLTQDKKSEVAFWL